MNAKILLLLISVCYASFTLAHPHDWIDVKTTFVINDDAQIIQVKQRWAFDVYFSNITYSDLMAEHHNERLGLALYADKFVKNLSKFDYFSHLLIDGQGIELGDPIDYSLIINKETDAILLELEMQFDTMSNEIISNKSIEWLVYDPTFYVAMTQESESSLTVLHEGEIFCQKKIVKSKPTDKLVMYAQSLDKNQTDTLGLGVKFAERAVINCA